MTLPLNIDDYLDRMLDALRLDGKASRRALVETEDHLRTATEAKMASGLSQLEAERTAIAEFGYPEQVADRFNRELLPGGAFAPVIQLGLSGALVTAVIFIAIGVSGALAMAFGVMWGNDFVAEPLQAAELSAERCAEFLTLVPNATDCQSAGLQHHFDEIVGYRLSTGILGIMLLAGFLLARRYWPPARTHAVLPRALTETMGAAAFAVGALVLLLFGMMDGTFTQRDGLGDALSAEIVAIVFLIGFTTLLVRRIALRDKPFRAR